MIRLQLCDDIKLSSKLLKSLDMLAYATRICLSAELAGGGAGEFSTTGMIVCSVYPSVRHDDD